jgi:hypothetical protein
MEESASEPSNLPMEKQQTQSVRTRRGWTPLKYPKSALLSPNSSTNATVNRDDETQDMVNDFFPLHQDILLATIRELLILDGNVNAKTLTVKKQLVQVESLSTSDENTTSSLASVRDKHMTAATGNSNRRSSNRTTVRKRKETDSNDTFKDPKRSKLKDNTISNTPTENVAHSILDQVKAGLLLADKKVQKTVTTTATTTTERSSLIDFPSSADLSMDRPPRKVSVSSEFDQLYSSDEEKDPGIQLDICSFINLGPFQLLKKVKDIPLMLQTSISSEAMLRDAALQIVTLLVKPFSDDAVRSFMGYKAHGVARNRIICMMAGFLFDASHALFAWEQTEQEMLLRKDTMTTKEGFDLDDYIQKSLFDSRAMDKVGGFRPSSLLPHAISIGRLRRRNISWKKFAATAEGKKMLQHHCKGENTILSVGKRRRGQRLRQRHWLTSSLLWNHTDDEDHLQNEQQQSDEGESITASGQRSRSCSFASSVGEDLIDQSYSSRQAKLLAEMPNTIRLTIERKLGESWGVGLVRESMMCVVGKVRESTSNDKHQLVCGDLILHVRNERGEEASSPICAWYSGSDQDWYRDIVNLFKTSEELHLVIQRVSGSGSL